MPNTTNVTTVTFVTPTLGVISGDRAREFLASMSYGFNWSGINDAGESIYVNLACCPSWTVATATVIDLVDVRQPIPCFMF